MRRVGSNLAGALLVSIANLRRGVAGAFEDKFMLAVLLAPCLLTVSAGAAPEPVDEALPMVGTGGHGHTYPGATVPFGFVQLSPDTRMEGWDACSGYHYSDTNILGFSHTHLSGTGGIDLGELLIMPVTGPLEASDGYEPLDAERFKSGFSHANEVAQPGYYRVRLDRYNVRAELTATAHCGMHRYTFPASDQSHLLIDLVHGLGNRPTGALLKVESNTEISGYRSNNGWAKGKTLYFVIETSEPFQSFGLELNGKPLPEGRPEAKGEEVRAHLDFQTTAGEQIVLRVGLSPSSIEEAKKNLQTEIPGWNFDAVRQATRREWNDNLLRLQIECANPNVRQTFYSALYHTMVAPTLYNNADGSYRGADRKNHPSAGFQDYSTFSMWDIFRAEAPLLTLTEPERINDFVQSMLVFYQQSPTHALPVWPLANYETWCMICNHSIPIIYDAYEKGFRGFDAELAFQAMTNSALGHFNANKRQDEYNKFGYVPWVKGKGASVSSTLELAYDDWCIAQMAKALGKTNDYETFSKRAENYKNVLDPKTKFFRAKNPDGTFHEPFNPIEVAKGGDTADGSYTEADAWQYTFAVLQDVPGMIRLYGGDQAFIRRLDQFFDMDSYMTHWRIDVTGLIGQYAHGNEPDEQCAYLYALAGAQYKTAWRAREIMLTQYNNTPDGLCGNDDCGQISAWYVWSAMGLYPVNPAGGIYVIGSPLVQKAVMHLDPKYYPGGTFTVLVHSQPTGYAPDPRMSVYVQSARLDGQPLNRPWITQQVIAKGGTLELEMGLLPDKSWGKGK
ncbi:MAG: GH92 family glycosyl hydrolase [Verrucomicrobiota bacterium]|nr:GH92 family glycosyl hydrolase [Verrucomicrobiota bacterium]